VPDSRAIYIVGIELRLVYYTESDKTLMWDRWLQDLGDLAKASILFTDSSLFNDSTQSLNSTE